MAGKLSQESVQVLARLLTADRELVTGSRLEVQHRYGDRESGARGGWTLVLVDLVDGEELEVGSDVAFEVLLRRRPWTYRTTSDGLTITPARRYDSPPTRRGAADARPDEAPARAPGALRRRPSRGARVASV